MSHYKHFSFDLWLTLIRSNPLFKQRRSAYFHDHYNRCGKSRQEIEAQFRKVDLLANAINERTGKNIDADELYLWVISEINDGTWTLRDVDTARLYSDMDELLFEHMPVLYSDDTRAVLNHVKCNDEHTASILSNTGFIRGATLRQVLVYLGIDQYFDFQLYSDEEHMSKPNPLFFEKMIQRVEAMRDLPVQAIIHIGDNAHADIHGATVAGIGSLLINSNDVSITKLLTHAPSDLLTA